MSNWAGLLTALASLAAMALQWWLSSQPARAARKARDENVAIHNAVAGGDVSALRARLARLRAEGL
jgi:hypothetical protein